MADLAVIPMDNRLVAAASALQLYGNIDPDGSRDLAERALFAADRAGARGHLGSAPTNDEVIRAQNALARRGHQIDYATVSSVLHECFVYGWGGR
jgi:hypothetical protein